MRSFEIHSPQYEGPLDLLVAIVRREDLSITDLPLAPIAAQYLAYIEAAGALDVNLGMDWIELAARLIHWKSASLLPTDPSLPDPGEELRRELVRRLKALTGLQSWSSADSGPVHDQPPAGEDIPASLWTLRNKARTLRKTFEHRRNASDTAYLVEADPVTVEEMRAFALCCLQDMPPGAWSSSADWLDGTMPRERRIYLFLALLDLAAEGVVRLRQDTIAESVRVCRA